MTLVRKRKEINGVVSVLLAGTLAGSLGAVGGDTSR